MCNVFGPLIGMPAEYGGFIRDQFRNGMWFPLVGEHQWTSLVFWTLRKTLNDNYWHATRHAVNCPPKPYQCISPKIYEVIFKLIKQTCKVLDVEW